MNKKETLHIYVRCSTEKQIENSIKRQTEQGVKFSKRTFVLTFSGSSKFISETFNKAKYLSWSLGALISPSTESPVLNPNLLIWLGLT